jgi:FkbM family methyltransferase
MGRVINLYKKIFNKIVSDYSYEGKEVRRIRSLSRYQNGYTKILGFKFRFADSASFVGQYIDIFKREIYNFKAINNQPYIIDCGANVGISVLYFKTLYPNAEIIAFEPDKDIFAILKENIDNSNHKKVTLINKALWNTEGKTSFIDEGADGGKILDSKNIPPHNLNIIEVETTSLRACLNQKVDFLKIDIEGAETIVIEDCENLLHNVERIFIEFHSAINKPQQLDVILNILSKNNFRYYLESARNYNKSPFISPTTVGNYDNFINIYGYRN